MILKKLILLFYIGAVLTIALLLTLPGAPTIQKLTNRFDLKNTSQAANVQFDGGGARAAKKRNATKTIKVLLNETTNMEPPKNQSAFAEIAEKDTRNDYAPYAAIGSTKVTDLELCPKLLNKVKVVEGEIIDERWIVGRRLGCGTHALVVSVNDMDGYIVTPILMKLDIYGYSIIVKRIKLLNSLSPIYPSAYLHAAGTYKSYNYLVMDRNGPSLKLLQQYTPNQTLSLCTALRVLVALMEQLRITHGAGFLHCDINQANVVVDFENGTNFMFIDWHTGRKYTTESGQIIWDRQCKRKYGYKYGHTNTTGVKVHGYHDDVIAAILTGVALYTQLYWTNDQTAQRVATMEGVGLYNLFKWMPQLHNIKRTTYAYDFGKIPPYARIISHIKEISDDKCLKDHILEWVKDRKNYEHLWRV